MNAVQQWLRGHSGSVLMALLAIGAAGSLTYSHRVRFENPWVSDLCLGLGTTFLTFFLAIAVVEWLQGIHQEAQWEPVSHHIGFHVRMIGNRVTLAYRTAVGIPDEDIPEDKIARHLSDEALLQGMIEWTNQTVVPMLPNLRKTDKRGWSFCLEELSVADANAKEVLLLFGNRLKPDIYARILDLRQGIRQAHLSFELFGPVLGTTVEEAVVTNQMLISEVIVDGLQHGLSREEVFQLAIDVAVEDAIERAVDVLGASTALLAATLPLLPKERKTRNRGDPI